MISYRIKYTREELLTRYKYLSGFKDKIDSYRRVMLEPNCPFKDEDDDSLGIDGLFPSTPVKFSAEAAAEVKARNYSPSYSVRYQEYLNGNNGLQAL